MEWTDIKITVPKASAEAAEAIATGISGGGIYRGLLGSGGRGAADCPCGPDRARAPGQRP